MSGIDTLPPLRQVIETHGIAAKKALGQNFLLDLNLTAKIARLAGDLSNADVLEVGPGPGGLTRGLLAEGARKVLAIEKDPRCMAALKEISAHYPDRLEVIWESLTLMFQREVAQRIVAQPGSKAYGRLAILAQWRTEARIVLDLPPEAFSPPPKVNSAVVHLTALPKPHFEADQKILEKVGTLPQPGSHQQNGPNRSQSRRSAPSPAASRRRRASIANWTSLRPFRCKWGRPAIPDRTAAAARSWFFQAFAMKVAKR